MANGKTRIEVTEDNTDRVISELDAQTEKILTMIGMKIEKYAKALCPVGTTESTGKKGYRGGTLRNSITFDVSNGDEEGILQVGSNVEYAPYVELGTGPNFTPPPEWEQFGTTKGSGMPNRGYVKPRPFLQPAIKDHLQEYENLIENELQ